MCGAAAQLYVETLIIALSKKGGIFVVGQGRRMLPRNTTL